MIKHIKHIFTIFLRGLKNKILNRTKFKGGAEKKISKYDLNILQR